MCKVGIGEGLEGEEGGREGGLDGFELGEEAFGLG